MHRNVANLRQTANRCCGPETNREKRMPRLDQAIMNSEAIETLLTLLSVAVRLEPELLRSIRKLLPETRDNPGIESLVWQSALVASPNCIAADLDATERKKWITEFAHQAPGLRRAVLKRIRAVVLVPDQRCGTGAEMGAAWHLSDGIARHGRRAIR